MALLSKEQVLDAIELPDVLTAEDEAAALQRGLDLLRRPTKSGFQDVFPSASKINPWQAKPYVRPHVQRSLGLFATPEEAAIQVLLWIIGRRPTPPSPDGSRNKRGEGKKKRDRRKVPGHASLFAMPCCFQPLTAARASAFIRQASILARVLLVQERSSFRARHLRLRLLWWQRLNSRHRFQCWSRRRMA